MSDRLPQPPIFIDATGRRWRHIRRVALVAGVATTVLALVLVGTLVLFPPIPPELPLAQANNLPIARPTTNRLGRFSKVDRLRIAYRRKLAALTRQYGATESRHPEAVPAMDVGTGSRPTRTDAIVAGFYVNWADNAFSSLSRNYEKLDWVIGEWGFVPVHGDSLQLRIDHKVIDFLNSKPPESRPSLFLMVSNFVVSGTDSSAGRFDAGAVERFLADPVARANAVRQLRTAVLQYGLAGTTLDLEGFPPAMQPRVLTFAKELHDAMHGIGRLSTQALAVGDPDAYIRRAALVNDKLFPMLFDEHYSEGEPGPIASQGFYVAQARRFSRLVPPSQLILMVGAYGFDWNDAEAAALHRAESAEFQEVMRITRNAPAPRPRFDPVSLNPYMVWTSPDSTDHVLWFLDATTAYNEMRVGHALGVAGHAIWRLGGEDPSIWNAVGVDGGLLSPDSLTRMPPSYDAEFNGTGEILQITYFPADGRRNVHVDTATGYVTAATLVRPPVPYVMARTGGQPRNRHRVALTFDDGPDPRWTPMILDTLRSRGVRATFFVVGQNVDTHLRLLQREYAEGHEIGNHTYTHPNMALQGERRDRIEIDATASLVETVLNRRIAFFRPPYFGDAEPTTADELVPVGIASRRNYWTIGLHVDAEDWKELPRDSIVALVMQRRESLNQINLTTQDSARNIVLLHDAGGNRINTVAALGPLIDSLRAHGDTIVLVSELAGITRDDAMPPLPPSSQATRLLRKAGWVLLGAGETLLFWTFTTAVVLGIARLVLIGLLAVVQRVVRHQQRGAPVTFTPGVSVIVPAYNEEKVVIQTITSLLNQRYAGELEIVVVDDGSSDDTATICEEAYGQHAMVTVYRKPNGGKASALNYGIARARHDIVIGLDADTMFDEDTVAELVQPLASPQVAAVAGNAKVGNRINLVTRWQALEYVTSQNLDRRAFSLLDCITVVPGSVGAWRRSLVQEAGGFKEDTLAEDQDLTMALLRMGYSVAYADGAIAYTEAPDTFKGLAKQRFRWSFGTLQCTWKHRDAFFRRKYGSLGFIALPNVFLFQLLLPAISPVADLMFVLSILSVWLNAMDHRVDGRLTYGLTNLEQVLTYYAIFLLVDWLAAVLAFLMESDEDKQLTWLIFLQRFAYRQVMYWVVVRSFGAALSGRLVGWGKLDRKATVEIPEHAPARSLG
ncbi:MAG: glycosyl transferase [Gemmatimonadetes bacterium]|jgi:cellulose synthase/poly-beta-1,6-N-acetylglucosamine synthase-like glycosyltransferase/peptidoglycan/xylan/chitin deacetylase (PgdA/CDA1 family)/spore germination protein YaaH|nr:glycosyl transferase [Gemmatimonadota bacterium]